MAEYGIISPGYAKFLVISAKKKRILFRVRPASSIPLPLCSEMGHLTDGCAPHDDMRR